MSTRGMYGFYKDGVTKATYNHYDSYPSCLGHKVINFLSNTTIEQLNAIFNKIILVNEDILPTKEEVIDCWGYCPNRREGDSICWTELLSNSIGDLSAYKNNLKYMIDNSEFIKDSLFCEWAYIINLDNKTLEVYKGFQKNQNEPLHRYSIKETKKYYSCALIANIPIENISIEIFNTILSDIDD